MKHRALIAAALSLVAGSAGANDLIRPLPSEAGDLNGYRWEKRPVLVFAPSEDDPALERQIGLFEDAAPGLEERDIVVLTDTDDGTPGTLRGRLAAKSFEVILVGKDGGVKLRSDSPVTPEALFATIDRMPMRRREAAGEAS